MSGLAIRYREVELLTHSTEALALPIAWKVVDGRDARESFCIRVLR